tara:strand:- start:25600 stop:26025 length:426 start_codon:yes stop_codon:yes gene_type:complete
MRKGEVVLELDGQSFTGRMPIPALEFLQERTGKHPIAVVRAFEAEEELPSWSDTILIAGLRGGGMDLALAEQLISGETPIFIPFAEKRMIALALLLSGLYAPVSGGAADEGKKPLTFRIKWISRLSGATRSLWALLRKSAS